jgi:quercetin dioxygenase-like cupin family protein
MKLYEWNSIEDEPLNPRMTRRALHTGNLTIARLRLQKDAIVPEHSHHHEQVSMVEQGSLKFRIGGREMTVSAGQALAIGPDESHAVEALEDTMVIDVFSPAREDWIHGDDAYLRS